MVCARPTAALFRSDGGLSLRRALRVDLFGFFFDQTDHVVDDIAVLQPVVRLARKVDHVGAFAAAGNPDVGFPCLTRPVDDATDDRDSHGRSNV